MLGPFLFQAVLYNDKSVLENFHSSLAFRILQEEDCNIFAYLTDFVSVVFPSQHPWRVQRICWVLCALASCGPPVSKNFTAWWWSFH